MYIRKSRSILEQQSSERANTNTLSCANLKYENGFSDRNEKTTICTYSSTEKYEKNATHRKWHENQLELKFTV